MAEPIRDVAHHVLEACAKKGSDGFYPRVDSANLAVERQRLDATLDLLRLGGFIEIADWSLQKGQGYRITDAGRHAAAKPDLLRRPAAAAPVETVIVRGGPREWDRAEEVRQAVLSPGPAIVTRVLIAVNVAVFILVGVYNVQHGNTFNHYLAGRVVPNPGILVPLEFFGRGAWWQLLSYSFLHYGMIHIGMNMYCLFSLGEIMETRWGWKRYLVLYFGSGLIAGVAILVYARNPMLSAAGASGAIAGLMTSVGVWAWTHRRYLPPQFVEANFRTVCINLALLVGIGFVVPNVSMAGHVGGAIGGALLSVPLTWLSPNMLPRHRILGAVAILAILALSLLSLELAPRFEIEHENFPVLMKGVPPHQR
jgi:rhomboid protease GluP